MSTSSGHSTILYMTTELSHSHLLPEVGLLEIRFPYSYVISKVFSNSCKKRLLACFRWSSLTWIDLLRSSVTDVIPIAMFCLLHISNWWHKITENRCCTVTAFIMSLMTPLYQQYVIAENTIGYTRDGKSRDMYWSRDGLGAFLVSWS